MNSSAATTASFSATVSTACAQNANSLVWTFPPSNNQYNYANSNPATGASFGNYVIQMDDWPGGNQTMWINDQNCWGTTTSVTTDNGLPVIAPQVIRGWMYNGTPMMALSTPGTYDWTTKSGMGIQVSALTKAKAHWAVSVPAATYPAARWDALLDVFFHKVPNPNTQAGTNAVGASTYGWNPQVDLMIMHSLVDSGYFKQLCQQNNAQIVTLGGISYVVIVDVGGPFNQANGGHTIMMFARPTALSDPGTTYQWGNLTATHDLNAIIKYWMQTNPLDDSGNPMKYGSSGWSPLKGQPVTSAMIDPSWYLTAVNGDFEVNYAPATGNPTWSTTDFWVAVQNEPDGQ